MNKPENNSKKIIKISFIAGVILGLLYLSVLILFQSENYSSLKISENLVFIIVVSLVNGLFYAMFSYLFVYFRNKFTSNMRWIAPLILTIFSLIVYTFVISALTIGFIIGLTGF